METAEQYLKSIIEITKTEKLQWRLLASLLLILRDFTQCSDVSIVDFEQVNTGWNTYTYLITFTSYLYYLYLPITYYLVRRDFQIYN